MPILPSQWVVAYIVLSAQNVLAALQTIFPTATISGDYIVFSDAIDGHQEGDEYAIRITRSASSSVYASNGNPYPDRDTLVSVNDESIRYSSRSSFDGWVDTGEFSSPEVEQDSFEDTNIVGRKIKFQIESSQGVKSWTEGVSVTAGEMCYSSGSYYVATTSGTAGKAQPIHHQGIVSDGGVSWEYLHSGYGTATVVSVQDENTLTAIVDGFLPVLELGRPSYTWRNYQWSMWGYKQKYPSHVFFYKGRLCYFCPTDGFGCWFQASKTDNYMDFGTEEFDQVLDTCGINTLISGYPDNNINWFMSGDRLYCGSYSGEYNIYSGDSSAALSPTSCLVDPITTIGGAPVQALRYRGLNLFVGRTRNEVYSISYDYTTDDYVPENIGFMSSHLLLSGVRRWVALDNVDRNIYFNSMTDDLCVINYVKEVKYLGYYRVNLDGAVLDIASSNAGSISALYALVRRDDGEENNLYTIERVDSDTPSYLLCNKQFDFSLVGATIDVSEFVGKEVWIKNSTTGEFYKTTIESYDAIPDLPQSWQHVLVGLPMKSTMHGQPMSGEKLEGLQQKSVRFIVRLRDSGAFSYGSSIDFDKKYEYNNWSIVGKQMWDTQHKLITGDIQLPASFGYTVGQNKGDGEYPNDTGVGLNMYMDTPEPFCLLSVSCVYV